MNDRHLLIIGGGLAGLATGCYARRSGFQTTIVEHNLALGGVCTAWQRGHYTIDGCIHWLTGGRFLQLYQELEILSQVQLRALPSWMMYRNVKDPCEFTVTRDLDELVARLVAISPADAGELCRLREAANESRAMQPPLDAPELASFGDQLRSLWDLRTELGLFMHYRKPMGTWAREHLHSPRLQRAFTALLPETAPAFVLPMILGYLAQGELSRPVGGTAAFRRALEHTYRELGGAALLHSTVDEVLVDGGRACGVRLGDGEILQADAIVSTASMPETMLRLLGGRYEAQAMQDRLTRWKLFEPIVLVSFGVEQPYPGVPSLFLIDGIEPLEIGGRMNDHLYVRVGNDDPGFAPPGHCVVQVMLRTDYSWWATRGSAYHAAKDDVAAAALTQLEPYLPDLRSSVRTVDVATPLTYWNMARSWRGAYEGWMPSADSLFSRVSKKLHGLENFYMAGQWVEPGGGVPTALMTGRHAVQLLCADEKRPFVAGG